MREERVRGAGWQWFGGGWVPWSPSAACPERMHSGCPTLALDLGKDFLGAEGVEVGCLGHGVWAGRLQCLWGGRDRGFIQPNGLHRELSLPRQGSGSPAAARGGTWGASVGPQHICFA